MARVKFKDTPFVYTHHINSWAEWPEDRFVIANGLALCGPCHKFYHTYVREVRKNIT